MYKVFVNEKKLLFSKYFDENIEKKIRFEGNTTLEIAIDLLQNTSCPALNIYGENLGEIWIAFSQLFRVIEASGGIVRNKKEEILFIKRLGKWDLPKGKIEKGESVEQAALREVEEETGLQELTIEKFINKTFHLYTERNGEQILKTTHWFSMIYNGSKQATPQIEEGITEATWKNNEKIKRVVLANTFKNIQLILEEFESLK